MKIVRILLIALVILAVLAALAPMLLSGWIRGTAESKLSESLGTPVTIAELDLGWTSGAQIRDLRIERSENHPTAVLVKSIDAQPDMAALMAGDIIVPHLLVEGVEIRHTAPAAAGEGEGGGDDGGGGEVPAAGEREDLPLIDLSAEARDVTVIYETPEGKVSELRSIENATVKVKSGEPVTFTARYSGLSIDGSAEVFDGRKMRESNTARIHVAADGFDLATLADAARPWLSRLSGKMTIDETIEYTDAGVVAKGKVTVTDLVTGEEAARTPGKLEVTNDVDYAADGTSLEVTDFDLRASFGTVTAKGAVALDESAQNGKDLAFDSDLDLAKLSDFLGDLMDVKLAGRCRANGKARPSGDATVAQVDVVVDDLAATDEKGETTRLGRVTMKSAAAWNSKTRTLVIERSDTDCRAAKAKISGTLVMPEEGEMSGPLKVDIDGNLDELGVFADALAEMEVGGRVTAKGDVVLGDDASVDLVIGGKGVTATGLGEGGTLGPIDFSGEAVGKTTGEVLQFSKLLIKANGVDFDGSGARVEGEKTTVPVRTRLDFSRMKKLIRPFQPDLTLGGQSQLNGTYEKIGERSSANLKGDVKKLFAQGGPLGERTLRADTADVDLAFTMTEAGTSIDKLVAKLANAVTKSGDDIIRADVDTTVTYSAAGAFDVNATARNAVLQKQGERPNRIPSSLVIVAKGTTNESGQTVDRLRIEGDGIKVGGNARLVTNGLAEVKASGDLDLDKLNDGWLPLFLEGATGSGKGNLVVDMKLPQGTSQAKGNGRTVVRLDRLKYSGADLKEVVFIVDMKDGVAKITRGTSKLNGGDLRLTGTVDINGEQPLFDVGMTANKIELVREWQPTIARIIPLFSGLRATVSTYFSSAMSMKGSGSTWDEMKPHLNGTGALDCDAGAIKSPLMAALLSVTGGGPDLAFDAIQTKFEVKDGAVHQDDMYIDGSIVEVRMGGITGLDGRLDYDLGIKPKGGTPEQFQRFARILDPEGFLPLGLGGDIDDPSLKMPDPAKLVGGALEGAAKTALEGLIGGKAAEGGDGSPLDALGGLLGGKKDTKDTGGEKKKDNPLDKLGGLLGGKKDAGDPKDGGKKKNNPLDKLGGLLGGKKDAKDSKEGEKKKDNPLDRLGGLLGGKKDGEKKKD